MSDTASTATKLVPLAPIHAADAARLHIVGQPGTFLTSLGLDVLTVFYQALPQSQHGFGYALVDDTERLADPASSQSPLLGFISATTSVGTLFAELGLRHFLCFAPPLMLRFVRQPSLLLRSFQTVLYPFLNHEDGDGRDGPTDGPAAELLSIMVAPPMRSRGIGQHLIEALVAECQARSIALLDVTVDTQNLGAQQFYQRHGFELKQHFSLYGREMQSYRRQITG